MDNYEEIWVAIERLRKSGKRFIIAIDGEGFHFRETLSVSHRVELGEVHYDTKPITSANSLAEVILNGSKRMAEQTHEADTNPPA
jgi:hypothetical protein